MKLSSAYLYEQLSRKYKITGYAGLSGTERYLRPFLYDADRTEGQERGEDPDLGRDRVYVIPVSDREKIAEIENRLAGENLFLIFCCPLQEEPSATATPHLTISTTHPTSILNTLQQIYDDCERWLAGVDACLMDSGGIQKMIDLSAEFLGNPLNLMGLDFSLVAEAGGDRLPEKARLFHTDGVNIEFMNALLQDSAYQQMSESPEPFFFPDYISGFRSLNQTLFLDGNPTHKLTLIEFKNPVTEGNICILTELAKRLEYLLAHEESLAMTGDLEQIFQKILSDRTADYLQISRRLTASGWAVNHEYLCLILQITYLNQKQLSTKAICRYIRRQFPDSISFLYQEEVVTFFNLTRLGLTEDEAAARLVYFIRDSYLKAGYSRTMEGHMNLRRQYVQARTALDVGSRKKPYLWIHYFNQVAMPYILEQSTRRLPGSMLCHEGLLRLKAADEKQHTEYMETLKAYLNQHLGTTQAARQLFIHRSTFLYRLDRIKEILQSDLDDPEELFYLELSFRLLEQEEGKE